MRQAKPRSKSYKQADSGGLALFVTPLGAKHWHFRFTWKGKQPRISLGSYPQVSLFQRKVDHVIPPYLVPPSRQAANMVRKAHALTGGYHLILPGRNDPKKSISNGIINIALKRMDYHGRLTGHGIRSTLSTALNEMRDAEGRRRYDKDWIEA